MQKTGSTGATTVNSLTYTYDAVGNMVTAGDDNSFYMFDYDNLNRMIPCDNDGTPSLPNVVLDYAYDTVGNRISTADDSGITVEVLRAGRPPTAPPGISQTTWVPYAILSMILRRTSRLNGGHEGPPARISLALAGLISLHGVWRGRA